MHIIEVIPLALIPRHQDQILSYFFVIPLAAGVLVEVTLNNRKIKAIVIGSQDIKSQKLIYKKTVSFALKSIDKVISPLPQVSGWQFRIAQFLSDYYWAPLGICLKTVLPPFWGKKRFPLVISEKQRGAVISYKPTAISKSYQKNPTILFSNSDLISNQIKKQLQGGCQVFLMVAEKTRGRYFTEKYSALNPVFISSDSTVSEFYEIWQKVRQNEIKLVIGTRIGLFLPFSNLGSIIIEDESNEAYKSDMSPRYHAVDLAKYIADIYGARLSITAPLPRLETIHRVGLKNYKPPALKAKIKVINMVSELKAANFSVFSRELQDDLLSSLTKGQNFILYLPRRGHASNIYCQHCGEAIQCPNCSVSLVLHKDMTTLKSKLVCHHCGHEENKPEICPSCGSYKLKSFGVGVEKAVEELERFYKKNNQKAPLIFRLDSDATKNDDVQEINIIERFRESPGAVLVTTQTIFSHRHFLADGLIKAPVIGIISADTLANIPDFRTEESLFRQIFTLGLLAKEKLIIQTVSKDNTMVKEILENNVKKFLVAELENRKTFDFPPFVSLIKLSYRHRNPGKTEREAQILFQKLKVMAKNLETNFEIFEPYPSFIAKEKQFYSWIILIKNRGEELKIRNEILRIVPSGWSIDVDPMSII